MALGTYAVSLLKKLSMDLMKARSSITTVGSESEEIDEIYHAILDIEMRIDDLVDKNTWRK